MVCDSGRPKPDRLHDGYMIYVPGPLGLKAKSFHSTYTIKKLKLQTPVFSGIYYLSTEEGLAAQSEARGNINLMHV